MTEIKHTPSPLIATAPDMLSALHSTNNAMQSVQTWIAQNARHIEGAAVCAAMISAQAFRNQSVISKAEGKSREITQ